jgi:membrane-bound ClpP family serine protease
MEPWIWAVILLALGLGLSVLEVFLPSGGIIGFLAASAILAAILVAFREGSGTGLAVLSSAMVTIPVVIALALRFWPKTAIGRRMLLSSPESDEILPDNPRYHYLKGLVGRVGVAKSKMLPSGAVSIDGRTIDALSEGFPIEIGQRVRVMEARGNRVVVRPVTDEIPEDNEADPLARPIDTVVPDPFGESDLDDGV